MKLRKTDPWKPASDYSRELIGLTVNLLVNNISKATQFSANVIELRLLGCNPDKAEIKALKYGFNVISHTQDKPHGLRECTIIDSAGYCWVPCEKI